MALTAEEYLGAIGRAGLTYADEVLSLVGKEKKGCIPDWGKAVCWYKLIKAAEYFFSIGDYISSDAIYFYNQMLLIAGTGYSTATLDPNAQQPSNIDITVINTAQPTMANRTILYTDPIWNVDHTTYNEPLWANFRPSIFQNGANRFLLEGTEFTYLPNGGFILVNPVQDGDVFVVIGVSGQGVATISPIATIEVATYLQMTTLGTPFIPTFYKVANDEESLLTNSVYVWWPKTNKLQLLSSYTIV